MPLSIRDNSCSDLQIQRRRYPPHRVGRKTRLQVATPWSLVTHFLVLLHVSALTYRPFCRRTTYPYPPASFQVRPLNLVTTQLQLLKRQQPTVLKCPTLPQVAIRSKLETPFPELRLNTM